MNQPVFIISKTGETYSFRLISSQGELLLSWRACSDHRDCIERVAVSAIHAFYDNRFEKCMIDGSYGFVLKSGTGKIIGESPVYAEPGKRDEIIAITRKEIFFASIEEDNYLPMPEPLPCYQD